MKFERLVLTHDCGVACPGSGVHAAFSGAQRGYSLKDNVNGAPSVLLSSRCSAPGCQSGLRSVPSTSGGGGRPASCGDVGLWSQRQGCN